MDYDAIGFDADHCLVKYNVTYINEFLIPMQLRDLVEFEGFPDEVMDLDTQADGVAACLNYALWDIKTGWLLKLGPNKEILAAVEGKMRIKT